MGKSRAEEENGGRPLAGPEKKIKKIFTTSGLRRPWRELLRPHVGLVGMSWPGYLVEGFAADGAAAPSGSSGWRPN